MASHSFDNEAFLIQNCLIRAQAIVARSCFQKTLTGTQQETR